MSAIPAPSGRVRPAPVIVAAVLLALCIVGDLVGPLLPGSEGAPVVGFVLTVIGIVALVGLWLLRRWGYIATLVVAVLNVLLAIPEMFSGTEAWVKIGESSTCSRAPRSSCG